MQLEDYFDFQRPDDIQLKGTCRRYPQTSTSRYINKPIITILSDVTTNELTLI